jgi:hypothetical protein
MQTTEFVKLLTAEGLASIWQLVLVVVLQPPGHISRLSQLL